MVSTLPLLVVAYDKLLYISDMALERNTLMSSVFPHLKKYCKDKYNYEFQVAFHFTYQFQRGQAFIRNSLLSILILPIISSL